MAINIIKVRQTDTHDVFSYRDDFNDEQLISFPKMLGMTENEVENYLNE